MNDGWKVRRGEHEWCPRDASELSRWAEEGQVLPDDCVYCPRRQRWTTAAKVPEILSALATAEIRHRRRRIRAIAFAVLATMSVLTLFVSRPLGVVAVSACAVVASILLVHNWRRHATRPCA